MDKSNFSIFIIYGKGETVFKRREKGSGKGNPPGGAQATGTSLVGSAASKPHSRDQHLRAPDRGPLSPSKCVPDSVSTVKPRDSEDGTPHLLRRHLRGRRTGEALQPMPRPHSPPVTHGHGSAAQRGHWLGRDRQSRLQSPSCWLSVARSRQVNTETLYRKASPPTRPRDTAQGRTGSRAGTPTGIFRARPQGSSHFRCEKADKRMSTFSHWKPEAKY